MTTENIIWAIFILGSLGILIPRVQRNGVIAGSIFSIFPIIGLAITMAVLVAFAGLWVAAANSYEEKQHEPDTTVGTYYDTPEEAWEDYL